MRAIDDPHTRLRRRAPERDRVRSVRGDECDQEIRAGEVARRMDHGDSSLRGARRTRTEPAGADGVSYRCRLRDAGAGADEYERGEGDGNESAVRKHATLIDCGAR